MHEITNIRYILLLVTLVPSTFGLWNKYFAINSNNWKFNNVSRQEKYLHKIECLILCDHTIGCATVNHNSEKNFCEIINPGQRIRSLVSEKESNWIVFYKDNHQVLAVSAWQSSTYKSPTDSSLIYPAYLAIDGNLDNNVWENCAHTNLTADSHSVWVMEFDHVVEVSHIIVLFKNDDNFNYRNSNLRLLISGTRQDSDNNIGTDCATYIGPPASSLPPVKITCSKPVTGKFLKIIHQNVPQYLVLCEVEVFKTQENPGENPIANPGENEGGNDVFFPTNFDGLP